MQHNYLLRSVNCAMSNAFGRHKAYVLFALAFLMMLSTDLAYGQSAKSTTTLFTLLTQESLQKEWPAESAKLKLVQSSGLYKQSMPVQIGNLAKIQKMEL